MACVLFFHAHHRHAVRAAFWWQVKIDNLRELLLQQRHEHFVQGHAQYRRLVYRLACVSAVVNRVLAHGDALYREHREVVLLVVITGVVAIRAF